MGHEVPAPGHQTGGRITVDRPMRPHRGRLTPMMRARQLESLKRIEALKQGRRGAKGGDARDES